MRRKLRFAFISVAKGMRSKLRLALIFTAILIFVIGFYDQNNKMKREETLVHEAGVRMWRPESENSQRRDAASVPQRSNPEEHRDEETIQSDDKFGDIIGVGKCRYPEMTNGKGLCSSNPRVEPRRSNVTPGNDHRGSKLNVSLVKLKGNGSHKHLDPWVMEQRRRKARLRRVCVKRRKEGKEYMPSSIEELVHLLVDDKHKAIYCYVPKVGCTNWKRVWMILSGLSNEVDPINIPEMLPHTVHNSMMLVKQPYSASVLQKKLETYKKLVVVRDPYERLLSAFRDKLERSGNNYYETNVASVIKKRFRGKQKDGDEGITFSQFVKFLNTRKQGEYDEHWRPYSHTCFPCGIRYDIIGKYETLVEDSERFLRLIGAPEDLHYPPYSPRNTSSLLPHYLDTLSPRQLIRLHTIYKTDLEMFDYKPRLPQDTFT
ncbi:hypothetical protein Pmani_023029 [Petrolisthes manimaculis]|uniref:Carbohydrate sulfotransferase n=1 Tax=Petrolisthes manimaculis TaxID=1843537 RepID=A0AAE1PAT3_9EUCA|nr:hypothetical protein Pmani_023029 [Petrolisthes manimaculis]